MAGVWRVLRHDDPRAAGQGRDLQGGDRREAGRRGGGVSHRLFGQLQLRLQVQHL